MAKDDEKAPAASETFVVVNDQTGERKDATVDRFWGKLQAEGWRIEDPAAYRTVADAPVMGEAQVGTAESVARQKAAEARAAADAKAAEEAAKGA